MTDNARPRRAARMAPAANLATKSPTTKTMVSKAAASAPATLTDGTLMTAILTELRVSNHLLAIMAVRDMELRRAVVLLDAAGLPAARIADAVGMTTNAVRVALHRARKSTAATASRAHTDEDSGGDEA